MGINSASLLFKKVFAGKASSDNTTKYFAEGTFSDARLSVFSGDIWSEAHLIPDSGIGNITGSISPGESASLGVVEYYSASGFSYLPGTSAGFSSSIKDWVPFNFGDGTTYSYKLLSNNGTQIPSSDDSSWTFDTEAGVLIFHEGFPTDNFGNELINTTLMPSMSAYAYIGKKLSDGINSTSVSGSFTGSFIGSLTGTSSFAQSSSTSIISHTASFLTKANNYSIKSLTSSIGLFFTSSETGIKTYTIDFAKVTGNPDSGSLNISASNLAISGNVGIDGILSFNGVNFSEGTISTSTGSTIFGSGSTGSIVQSTIHQLTGSLQVTGSGLFPNSSGTINLGSSTQKWTNLFAVNTFFGGIHEINLETKGLDKMQEGTILSLKKGVMYPCEAEADPLVMGVVSKESNYPIVLGAEPILITGEIKEGDYIITSNIKGHGKGVNPKYIYNQQLFGKIIAQAIENGKGKSYTIKAMIRKM